MPAPSREREDAVPLQNRVDPFGAIRAAPERGLFTGNRGVVHDPATRTLLKRRWTTKAWIVCALAHPCGLTRRPMGRNGPAGGAGWTELFFLDEVTALAAGHRPCFYCRREAALSFRACFAAGTGMAAPDAPAMDDMLHRQRLASDGVAPFLAPDEAADLPDGAMIAIDGRAHAIRGARALPWHFSGYDAPRPLPRARVQLLTPPATVAALRAGYRPAWG